MQIKLSFSAKLWKLIVPDNLQTKTKQTICRNVIEFPMIDLLIWLYNSETPHHTQTCTIVPDVSEITKYIFALTHVN